MCMNIFIRLDPDIMHTHILPRLDGTTLTVLSSISSELRHMIRNNQDLWRNICTSTWPSLLLDPIVNNVISTFPGGYRSFFTEAFPSLHRHNNNCCHHPSTELIHAVNINLYGEPLFPRVWVKNLNTKDMVLFDKSTTLDGPTIHIPVKERWTKYLMENLTLSWIIIDPTRKRARNLFRPSYKTFQSSRRDGALNGEAVLAWEDQEWTKMVIQVMFDYTGGDGMYDKFQIRHIQWKKASWRWQRKYQ